MLSNAWEGEGEYIFRSCFTDKATLGLRVEYDVRYLCNVDEFSTQIANLYKMYQKESIGEVVQTQKFRKRTI